MKDSRGSADTRVFYGFLDRKTLTGTCEEASGRLVAGYSSTTNRVDRRALRGMSTGPLGDDLPSRLLTPFATQAGVRRDDSRRLLERYIRENLLVEDSVELTSQTRLISDGIVDSMGMVMLAAFVEGQFGVEIAESDLVPGGLETIDAILARIELRQ